VKQFVLAAALLSAFFVSAQNASKAQLGVRLSSESASCSLRGKVRFEVVRVNTGNGRLLIYRRWEWGTISKLRVFDSKGNEITDVLWPIDDPPSLRSTDFILLNSGESLGTPLTMSVKQFAKSPGDYEFLVEYRSYLSEDLVRKYIPSREVQFWSRERSTVTSNKIKLRITE
jgi:hypothetical protein